MTKYEQHQAICKELNNIYISKNKDYGNGFSDMYKRIGPITALTRIGDKYNRYENLTVRAKERLVKNESVEDTLLDMANYCIMTIIEMRESNEDL